MTESTLVYTTTDSPKNIRAPVKSVRTSTVIVLTIQHDSTSVCVVTKQR